MDAKARAQAHVQLDDAVRALKRIRDNATEAIHTIRQAQVQVLGIELETITKPEGGHSANKDRSTP